MLRVFVDPDGTQEHAVYALVLHPTGVCYSTQCAGLMNDIRMAEGFLIPLGGQTIAKPLMDWFWKTFKGHSYEPATGWGTVKITALQELIAQIPCWYCSQEDNESKMYLELDETRLAECTEAWIPVVTPYGAGILLFPNCD